MTVKYGDTDDLAGLNKRFLRISFVFCRWKYDTDDWWRLQPDDFQRQDTWQVQHDCYKQLKLIVKR